MELTNASHRIKNCPEKKKLLMETITVTRHLNSQNSLDGDLLTNYNLRWRGSVIWRRRKESQSPTQSHQDQKRTMAGCSCFLLHEEIFYPIE
ncbi:hypothetical protein TNCT_123351 [Trichonephila clavata]|uniref:Uncharacterized protein n=1 Tax=Trichonephila clavata TaxID=2740835 RepID=A0A8X6L208_TRICU|nr:hypothetical protein TNCT_123351 [Trichonephila clavata]